MGRPARKKVYAETKAAERAKYQAQREAERKKPIEEKLLDFIKENAKEMPKWTALLGMTVLVKQTMDTMPAVVQKMQDFANTTVKQMLEGGPPLQAPLGTTPQLEPVQKIPKPGEFPKVG